MLTALLATVAAAPCLAPIAPLAAPTPHAQGRIPRPGEDEERARRRAEAKKPAPPARLSQSQTQVRIVQYRRGEHWALRSLVLLSLGPDYHPAASEVLLDALESKDDRLRIYGLETLARTKPDAVRCVLTSEIVDNLIRKQLKEKDEHYRSRVFGVLKAAFPAATVETRQDWERHWYGVDKTFTPDAWVAPEVRTDGKSAAAAPFERALDLYEAGLDVVICIDSTGSMQPTIDAAALAIDDLVTMLEGIAPQFRLGLVHYKDFGDFSDGAKVLEPLSKRHAGVRDTLANLAASGGGDAPERVEEGLRLALDPREMKWRHETNKLIVVLGDAPAHHDAISDAVGLARDSFEMPFGKKATPVRPSERDGRSRTKPTRPFVTACIGVGQQKVDGRTRSHFQEISDAGGGTYAELRGFGDDDASDQIVGHVLKLSFGAQYEGSLDTFVEVFFTYHRREVFR